ncbi:MAG: hypothetical protein HC876_17895 [Chloroflexaceae bacterium]|nr:hypothetical protein [Chloroflexaceae bacterium]
MQEPPVSPGHNQDAARRRMMLWGAIAGLGAVLVLVLFCGLILAIMFVDEFELSTIRFGSTPTPTAPAPPEAPDPPEPVLQLGRVDISEDFEQPTTLWHQATAQVIDGSYELRLDTAHTQSYGLYLGHPTVSNFDMAVDVQQVAGDLTAEYGIRFRQSGPGDYLIFSLSGTGFYRLARVTNEQYETLVPWTFDSRLTTGLEASNRLRVVAQGERIEGYINGTRVVEYTDIVGASGQLTLGLGTFDGSGVAVRFDNLEGFAEGFDLTEDFSDAERVGWSIAGSRLNNGAFELFAGGGLQTWQQPLPAPAYEVSNFVLEVEATMIDGGASSAYGLMFGDGGFFDFYALYITPNGQLTITASDANGNSFTPLPPMNVDAIEAGLNATNQIRIEVRGQDIQITINGEALPPLRSQEPISGMAGMIITSGESGRTQVLFDNFTLEEIVEGDAA